MRKMKTEELLLRYLTGAFNDHRGEQVASYRAAETVLEERHIEPQPLYEVLQEFVSAVGVTLADSVEDALVAGRAEAEIELTRKEETDR